MRQTVFNAQGADVLVLSKKLNEDVATLDLYQAKHYDKLPSRGSKETISAFASLGVFYDAKEGLFDMEPQSGSAGYSYKGTKTFVEELSDALEIHVKVRKRVIVFSAAWESFVDGRSWKDFDFEAARLNNLWIWSRETLEPTISALVTTEPVEFCSSDSEAEP